MKKKLKIGIFIDNFYPAIDGVVLVVDNLAKELSKYNDVTVVIPDMKSKEELKRPYKIIKINSYNVPSSEYKLGKYKTKYSKTFKKLLEENFDIIHIHSPFTIGNLGLRIAKKLNIPSIATMHTRFDFEIKRIIPNNFLTKKIIKKIIKPYNECDKCIAVNHAMINVFKDYGYIHQPVVIHNGTDLQPLTKEEEYIEKINKLWKFKKEETVLLFVGRIIDIKNIFFILDSLKLLKEDGFPYKMIYVGTGPDENKLKEKIKEYYMENDIIMAGKITDRKMLSAIYKRANLFLFPSLFDASSLVQIEAAINGTPGLFIEKSVTADTITNNINGFTSKNNVKDYKNRIEEIITNKDLLKNVSKNAKKMLGKTWMEIAEETYNLYNEEIKKKEIKKEKAWT